MTTTKWYDNLNRLTAITNAPSDSPEVSFVYGYNSANQRTARTDTDASFWVYTYDSLGQVTSGKKYWSDGTPVLRQQFDYSFDDIGNRKLAISGGDQYGANERYENYTANELNQYTQRTVPGYLDVLGAATNAATVTVNNQAGTLSRFSWPSGCSSIICGSNDDDDANCRRKDVKSSANAAGLNVVGVSGNSGCGVNADGTWWQHGN